MKTSLLEKNKDFILFLNKLSKKERSKILQNLGSPYINTISEIFSNFLLQNLTQDHSVIKKLKNYKKEVRAISKKKSPLHLKKKLLKSKKGGAILSFLLPLAATLISSLIRR